MRFVPFLLTLILIPVFWWLIVRPQQQRQKEHLATVAALAPGDRVMTVGGIVGTLQTVEEELVTVEVADGVVLTLGRTFVRQRIDDEVAVGSDVEDDVNSNSGPGEDPGEGTGR